MAFQDYFALFGVSPVANENEIRSAYRRLVLQFHPDRNPNDPKAEEKFKEISVAYEVLSDPKARAEYSLKYAAFQDSLRQRQISSPGEKAAVPKPKPVRAREKAAIFRYEFDGPILHEKDAAWGIALSVVLCTLAARNPLLYPAQSSAVVMFFLPVSAAIGGGTAGLIGASFARAFLSVADNWPKVFLGYSVGALVSLGASFLLCPFAVLVIYGLFFSTRFYDHLFVSTLSGSLGGVLAMILGSRRKGD